MSEKKKVGILVSGHGSNARAIAEACRDGRIDAEVAFVGSDRPGAGALNWARGEGIDTFVVDYLKLKQDYRQRGRFADRRLGDEALDGIARLNRIGLAGYLPKRLGDALPLVASEVLLIRELRRQRPFELLCLAGFMRILTPYVVQRISPDELHPRIMNIHPALLPSFPGTDGYGDTLRYGCRVGGCTVHYVDYGEDTGPIIGQRSFAVEPGDSADDVRRKGLALEHELYPECVGLHVAGRLALRQVSQRNGTRRLCVFMS